MTTDKSNLDSAINTNLGRTLRDLRNKKGDTQHQVAAELNTTHQNISNWERNYSTPNIDVLKELAVFYQVSLDELTCHVPAYDACHDMPNSKAAYHEETDDCKEIGGCSSNSATLGMESEILDTVNASSVPITQDISDMPEGSAMREAVRDVDSSAENSERFNDCWI